MLLVRELVTGVLYCNKPLIHTIVVCCAWMNIILIHICDINTTSRIGISPVCCWITTLGIIHSLFLVASSTLLFRSVLVVSHKGFPHGGCTVNMGYECPVCEIPQADGSHLANHVAFTAIIHGDEHEAWLDEHVSGWSDMGQDELADVLTEISEETTFPQVFEDTTTGGEHQHDHERSGQLFDEPSMADQGVGNGREQQLDAQSETLDVEARAVLEEARRMTETKLETDEE